MNNKKNIQIKPLTNQVIITPCDRTPTDPCGEEFKCKYILKKIDEITIDTISKISESVAIVKTHDQLVQELYTTSTLFNMLYNILIESFLELNMLLELSINNQTETSCCCCEQIVDSILSVNKAVRKSKTDLLNLLATKTTEHADTDPFTDCNLPNCFPLVNYNNYNAITPAIDNLIFMLGAFIEEIMLMHHFMVVQQICNNCNTSNSTILENYLNSLSEVAGEFFNLEIPLNRSILNSSMIKNLIITRKAKISVNIKTIITKISETTKHNINESMISPNKK